MLLFHYLKNLYVEILRNPDTFVKYMIIEDKKKNKRNKEREKKIIEKKTK